MYKFVSWFSLGLFSYSSANNRLSYSMLLYNNSILLEDNSPGVSQIPACFASIGPVYHCSGLTFQGC